MEDTDRSLWATSSIGCAPRSYSASTSSLTPSYRPNSASGPREELSRWLGPYKGHWTIPWAALFLPSPCSTSPMPSIPQTDATLQPAFGSTAPRFTGRPSGPTTPPPTSSSASTLLQSATGVRQGDPLGPLLFSLAIRPLLDRLSTYLGTDYLVLAYLDDVYVLSPAQELASAQGLTSTLEKIYSFFDSSPSSLKLNRTKCTGKTLSDIKEHGCNILGSCVGSPQSQAAFLASKIDKLANQVQNLASLPHQHALLLLRQCIQQDLQHLQRSLPDHPLINNQWTRLDRALWNEVRRLRGRVDQQQGDRQELEDAILSLPLRLGGLGVLSHLNVAPHALAASNEAADRHIDTFMNIQPSQQGSPTPAVKSQHERCQDMWETTQTNLIDTLDDTERKLLSEAASPLGRKWLNTIPFYQPLCLTDFEVSTALNYRTLACSPLTTCSWCSRPNSLGHDELCMTRRRQTVARHDSLARIIHSTLKLSIRQQNMSRTRSKAGEGMISASEDRSGAQSTTTSRCTPFSLLMRRKQPLEHKPTSPCPPTSPSSRSNT